MQKPSVALVATVALVITIAIALHLTIWLDAACSVPSRRLIMKATGTVGCFEFWLNRYQGLLGNVITAAVAGATLLWIVRQLETSDRQASVASSQALRARISDLSVELDRLHNVIGRVQGLQTRNREAVTRNGLMHRAEIQVIAEDLRKQAGLITADLEKSYIDGLRDERSMLYGAAMSLEFYMSETIGDRLREFESQSTDFNMRQIERINDDEKEALIAVLVEAQQRVDDFLGAVRLGIRSTKKDLEQTWIQVRRFEDRAVRG